MAKPPVTTLEPQKDTVDAQQTHRPDRAPGDARLPELVGHLTLDQKVTLLTGRDFWTTHPIESVGLRRMLISDGPSGVRGETWDERSPSLNLPSATALSSSWDIAVATRYGEAAAAEARRKGVDVVLGPTINLHRSPLGGRHFEAFSEDPVLTGDLAAAYVAGVQSNGIGATPKHYVANDFETERFTADVRVSERALREVYLLPFEKAVTSSHAWLVMSAYNSVNGTTATENALLQTPLNSEWGFDGVVISDWTAVRSLASAKHPQDLVMPGPDSPWGDALVDAVRRGDVPERAVDRKVLRILRLAARVGALAGFEQDTPQPVEDGVAFAREAAAEGTVMVRNMGVLPFTPAPARIAVIGHNARHARTQGGGSATVVPHRVVSPLTGIQEAFPETEVTYSLGAIAHDGLSELDPAAMINPVTGGPGAHVRFLDHSGKEIFAENRLAGALVYFGGDAPVSRLGTLEFTTRYTPDESGTARIGFASPGTGRVYVDGRRIGAATARTSGEDLGAALISPPASSFPVELSAGQEIELRVEFSPAQQDGELRNAMSLTIGTKPEENDPDELIAEAVAAAETADTAVVVVGTNAQIESEGHDRSDLSLPGRQDDLVRAVAAANPRTVAVVNSGSPVLLPWRHDVATVLLTYFGGQEYGHALADILTGDREPGGRLPTTWPDRKEDVPVFGVTPVDGVLRYDEGVHIGYRAWLKSGAEPAYPFGYGLGYTTWELGPPETDGFDGESAEVRVPVTNNGSRPGKHVVQVYAERASSTVDRPVRWLAGFGVVRAGAGTTVHARITVPRRAFAHWDGEWCYEPGEYTLRIGASVADLVGTVTVEL